ncbi:MAG: hypothetical protein JWP81_1815 [Ferruginibacter sp.]|nr:hypothetical protein [Ferruginibacter sp.]
MKKSIFFLLLAINTNLMCQSPIQGEYYFRRHEMVAGFNFSADGKFQFFYSYGAVDRSATGIFYVEGDTLKLKSDKAPGKDFTLLNQSASGKGYTIKFEHPNQYLVKNILGIFFVSGKIHTAYSDDKGQVHIDLPNCDSIFVQHQLYPDILTLVKDKRSENHSFKLSLNPSLEQVSFKGIDFKIVNDKVISCIPNYFMEMEKIEFVKE